MLDDQFDLIVVGTGFASTFFLRGYLDRAAPSARVLVLDRGYLYPHSDRLRAMLGQPVATADKNEPSEDTFVNATPEKPWPFSTGFGGGSNCWFGCTPRFMPNDFRLRSQYGVAADWPISYDELEAFYCDAEEIMSVSGPSDTPFPRTRPYPQPPHLFTPVDDRLKRRFGSLYINQPTARARVAVAGRAPCCANSVCSVCPMNAKFTIENSGMGVYEDSRVELRAGAQVFALELAGTVVRSVQFRRNGQDERAFANIVALGANSIHNPHILLNSGDTNPFTGRGLGEQLAVEAQVMLDGLSHVGGSTWATANGYMLYDGDHRRNHAACLLETNNGPYYRLERGKHRDMVVLRMIFEALPNEQSTVRASSDLMKPIVRHEAPGAYERAGIVRMKQQLPQLLSDLPVESIAFDVEHKTEYHNLGTARMSDTAATGVVDRQLVHHQYRNLFVLGGSAFTTFSPSNPTLTIAALSLFSARHSF